MQLTLNPQNLSMSSREIAELTGKDHAHVMRDIRSMLEVLKKDASRFGGIYLDAYGREKPCFHLDDELTLTLASGYDTDLRHRVVLRLKELQRKLDSRPAPQARPAVLLSPTTQVLADSLTAAELLGVPIHLAQTEAVKETERLTGRDFRNLLTLAPAQSGIRKEDEALEPTELGKLMGMSAVKCNQALSAAGLQVRSAEGWEPTSVGSSYAIRHHWTKAGKSGYNWKWKTSVIKLIEETK